MLTSSAKLCKHLRRSVDALWHESLALRDVIVWVKLSFGVRFGAVDRIFVAWLFLHTRCFLTARGRYGNEG